MVTRRAGLPLLAASTLLVSCARDPTDEPACPAGPPAAIATDDGPEDMALVPLADGSHRLLIRVENGIQAATLASDGTVTSAPERVVPAFDSLGLSYRPGDAPGSGELFAIDREAPGVRRFAVRGDRLAPRGLATADPAVLPSPNDLFAVPGSRDLYISNPDLLGIRSRLGRWPSVVLWREGGTPEVVVRDLGFANGIVADPAGRHLLIADYRARRLVAYRRNAASGRLTQVCQVRLPAMPDNLSLDVTDPDRDRVLVAAQESLPRTALHLLVSARLFPSPSRVYEVSFRSLSLDGPRPPGAVDGECLPGKEPPLVWADRGEHVAAGSTAVRVGDRLLVSQIIRPGIFSFACPRASAFSPS